MYITLQSRTACLLNYYKLKQIIQSNSIQINPIQTNPNQSKSIQSSQPSHSSHSFLSKKLYYTTLLHQNNTPPPQRVHQETLLATYPLTPLIDSFPSFINSYIKFPPPQKKDRKGGLRIDRDSARGKQKHLFTQSGSPPSFFFPR